MHIPLNGRIAIVDDKIEQALPLINILAQKKYPCQYYSGDLRYLPEEGQALNDIRILFLDINLLNEASPSVSALKSSLIGVLNRVISRSNFPWMLIYWSRHEDEHDMLVKEIFDTVLTDRKPIIYLSQQKSDYFSLTGEEKEGFTTKVDGLFGKIVECLAKEPAYQQLITWENMVHRSTDKTLKEVFNVIHEQESWRDNAEFLLSRLGESYAGKDFKTASSEEKIRSAFQTLNAVFTDTQEYETSYGLIPNADSLFNDTKSADKSDIAKINKKLLVSADKHNICYAGMVIEDKDPASEQLFQGLLNDSFNREKIQKENPEVEGKPLENLYSRQRQLIRKSWIKVHVVVTPLCDVVQRKVIYNRMVQGFLLPEDQVKYVQDKSEAIFVSPPFQLGEQTFALVLNLRYFYTTPFDPKKAAPEGLSPLFRLRQSLLAEIQSKLARHTSRQGVLFIG